MHRWSLTPGSDGSLCSGKSQGFNTNVGYMGGMVHHLGSLLCVTVDGRVRVQKFQQAVDLLAVGGTFLMDTNAQKFVGSLRGGEFSVTRSIHGEPYDHLPGIVWKAFKH